MISTYPFISKSSNPFTTFGDFVPSAPVIIIIIIIIIIIYSLRVFYISFSWYPFTGDWLTANPPPEFFQVIWLFLII